MTIARPRLVRGVSRVATKRVAYRVDDVFVRRRLTARRDQINRERIDHFRRAGTSPNPAQSSVLERLRSDGYAVVDGRELIADHALLEELGDEASRWRTSPEVEEQIEAVAGRDEADRKPYEVKRYPRIGMKLAVTSPLVRFAICPDVLSVVNSYFALNAMLFHADMWRTLPSGPGTPRRSSQQWHRDPEDVKVLKAFFYLRDVTESAGPLEYVIGSHGGGRWSQLSPAVRPHGSRLADADLERAGAGGDVVSAIVPRGTLVFVDTAGIHRGGYASTSERLICTWTFVSEATGYQRYFAPRDVDESRLSTEQLDMLVRQPIRSRCGERT